MLVAKMYTFIEMYTFREYQDTTRIMIQYHKTNALKNYT